MGVHKKDPNLLNPFENRRDSPRVIVYESSKALWEHARYIIGKTTTGDVSNSFYTTFANDVKNL